MRNVTYVEAGVAGVAGWPQQYYFLKYETTGSRREREPVLPGVGGGDSLLTDCMISTISGSK